MIPKETYEATDFRRDESEILAGKSAHQMQIAEKKRTKVTRDSMAVRWLDKHADKIEKYRARLPDFLGSAIATCAIFLLGATFRGEWLLIFVHFARRLQSKDTDNVTTKGESGSDVNDNNDVDISHENNNVSEKIVLDSWEKLSDAPFLWQFGTMWLSAVVTAYGIYFTVCGFLEWYYYICRRDKSEEWKCQPYKWLSPELERHEMILGISSLVLTNTVTALFSTYLLNGCYSMVYYGFDEYGWFWWFLQWPIIYVILDYETYWFHRLYHFPTMYKWFHKLHHTYKQPTAWSVTAIHPVEIVHMQLCYIMPLFVIPTHLVPYCTIMLYFFYHGILDHSGINFKAQWWQPWQPDASFHDNHHQYTHVNFGFNMFYWDKLHGTHRLKDRIYNENVFFGQGKKISEATAEELLADLQERELENVDQKVIYKLDGEEIKNIKAE